MLQYLSKNTALRSSLRRIGLLKLLKRLSRLRAKSYEDRFAAALLDEIRSGDVVWDVGANIGYYTCKLAERAGPKGTVFAFEPVELSFKRMQAAVRAAGLENVRPMHLALGHREQSFAILVTSDGDGVTNSLAKAGSGANTETITVSSGDALIASGALSPDVIKIDVEAYEEEVVFGLRNLWQQGHCRAIFIEVHFQQLDQRGLRRAPSRIEDFFKDCGYVVDWLDASHLQATKVRKG